MKLLLAILCFLVAYGTFASCPLKTKQLKKQIKKYQKSCIKKGFQSTLGCEADSPSKKPLKGKKLKKCEDLEAKLAQCEYRCPINGGWSEYGSWSACTNSCGGGTTTRTRTCTNPEPGAGGEDCSGSDMQTLPCNEHDCSSDMFRARFNETADGIHFHVSALAYRMGTHFQPTVFLRWLRLGPEGTFVLGNLAFFLEDGTYIPNQNQTLLFLYEGGGDIIIAGNTDRETFYVDVPRCGRQRYEKRKNDMTIEGSLATGDLQASITWDVRSYAVPSCPPVYAALVFITRQTESEINGILDVYYMITKYQDSLVKREDQIEDEGEDHIVLTAEEREDEIVLTAEERELFIPVNRDIEEEKATALDTDLIEFVTPQI